MHKKLLVIGLLWVTLHPFAKAQEVRVLSENIDTIIVQSTEHSPARAAMLSAAIPGLGQIYNKKYWKLPIVYGAFVGLAYYYNYSNDRYKLYRNAYYDAKIGGFYNQEIIDYIISQPQGLDLSEEGVNSARIEEFRKKKETFRKYRENSILYLVGAYLINIVDANVDAYFLKFNVNKDLTVKLDPFVDKSLLSDNIIGLKLSINYR